MKLSIQMNYFWGRPYEMFFETVVVKGEEILRFQLVEQWEKPAFMRRWLFVNS